MYFETAGVLTYGEAKKYDLASDLNHEVSADLTGPWGAKLFDKAVMFKSNELYVLGTIIINETSHDVNSVTELDRIKQNLR
jgi:hypothetical protein